MGQYLLHLCCCLPVKKEVQAMQVKEEELLFLNKMGVSLSKQYPHPKCCSVLASVGHTVCPFQNLHFNTSKLIGSHELVGEIISTNGKKGRFYYKLMNSWKFRWQFLEFWDEIWRNFWIFSMYKYEITMSSVRTRVDSR